MDINSNFGTDRLSTLPIPVSVRICQRKVTINDLISWVPGTLISFDQMATSRLTLTIGHRDMGMGHAVKVGSRIGIRLDSVGSTQPLPEGVVDSASKFPC